MYIEDYHSSSFFCPRSTEGGLLLKGDSKLSYNNNSSRDLRTNSLGWNLMTCSISDHWTCALNLILFFTILCQNLFPPLCSDMVLFRPHPNPLAFPPLPLYVWYVFTVTYIRVDTYKSHRNAYCTIIHLYNTKRLSATAITPQPRFLAVVCMIL